MTKPNTIDMGIIDPLKAYNQYIVDAIKEILETQEIHNLFDYSSPLVLDSHKKIILSWLKSYKVDVFNNIIATHGSQNALSIVLSVMFKYGDKIAVDNFTYANFKDLANMLNIQLTPIESDEYGMSPTSLIQACELKNLKGLYLMPSCTNPTTHTIPEKRRIELATVVKDYNLTLIEDDPYVFFPDKKTNPISYYAPQNSILPKKYDNTIGLSIETSLLDRGIQVYHSDRFKVGSEVDYNALRIAISSPETIQELETGLKILKSIEYLPNNY